MDRLVYTSMAGAKASLQRQEVLAHNLANLYDYMRGQLLQANLRNSPERLEEVASLLLELRHAWDELARRQRDERRLAALGEPMSARAG